MKRAIVVGSGAGGCAAARQLSSRFEVTVLEAGGAFSPFKHELSLFEPLRRAGLFFDERMIQALFPEMRVLKARGGLVHVNGRCIGGTTQLATGNALRYDSSLAELGIDLGAEFAELSKVVPMTQEHYRNWSDMTVLLYTVFEDLGYDPQVTAKLLVDAEKCTACGRCVLGCRNGAKWTAEHLLDGCANVEVVANCRVDKVDVAEGRARGVVVSGPGRRREVLEADLVVLAAGGLATPVILNASGFATTRTFFSDPVICVAAPWEGAKLDAQLPMPFLSQRDGFILSPYFDWLSFFFNGAWRRPKNDIVSIMVKYADSSLGSFDGRRLDKPVSQADEDVISRSVEEASRVLEHLGLREDEMFLGTLNAGHPGGCLPLTSNEAKTLHHAHLPENLYVADSTLFPKSMGNPPILTIMALATRVAKIAAQAV